MDVTKKLSNLDTEPTKELMTNDANKIEDKDSDILEKVDGTSKIIPNKIEDKDSDILEKVDNTDDKVITNPTTDLKESNHEDSELKTSLEGVQTKNSGE